MKHDDAKSKLVTDNSLDTITGLTAHLVIVTASQFRVLNTTWNMVYKR